MSYEEYAPQFYTFSTIASPNLQIRDNNARSYAEYVQVGFYTNDARLIYSVMDDFIDRAKKKGFIVEGRARDANADRDDYFGRICYLRIINKI